MTRSRIFQCLFLPIRLVCLVCLVCAGQTALIGQTGDDARNAWPSFRGPGASGVADGQGAPAEWDVSSGQNIRWGMEVPGASNSSPIVWGDRVFVTTAISGSGEEVLRAGLVGGIASLEDESEHTWKLYALDSETGQVVWERDVHQGVPGVKRHPKGSQASSTPVTDGQRVIVLFATIGVLASYDFDGELLWKTDIGLIDSAAYNDPTASWGHSSSPIIYENSVIVQADGQNDPFLAAYDIEDGSQLWKTDRGEDLPSWGTPAIANWSQGDELITNGTMIRGYDPVTGEERWSLGPNSFITVPTPVVGPDMVYVSGGYQPVRPIYAIRPGASGDISLAEGEVTNDAIAWSLDRDGPYIPTPLLYRDLFYIIRMNGVLTAYDADNGDQVYRVRVGTGTFTESPVAADGRLYISNEAGEVFVVQAGPEYAELARNEMNEMIMATPAISNGLIFVRTMNHIYAVGE
jgi:outer membrane protein assembly factor BamB